MPQIDEPTSAAPKAVPETRKTKTAAEKPPAGTYAFTVDIANGRVLGIEKVDGDARRALSPEERSQLAKACGGLSPHRIVEQAFEAGIEFVLGDGADIAAPESKQDGELSGMLLQTLIEGSKGLEPLKGERLDRTFIGALFSQDAKAATPAQG